MLGTRRAAVLVLAAVSSCAAPSSPTEFTVPAGGYADAFAAARDVLREFEFELDRVDAQAGVITTAPRASSGLATPWIPHASDMRGALEGLAQFEQRTARVEFSAPLPGDPAAQATGEAGERVCRVVVAVERFERPGRRVDPTSVRLRSIARDPAAEAAGRPEVFVVEKGQDRALAARIMAVVSARMNRSRPGG